MLAMIHLPDNGAARREGHKTTRHLIYFASYYGDGAFSKLIRPLWGTSKQLCVELQSHSWGADNNRPSFTRRLLKFRMTANCTHVPF